MKKSFITVGPGSTLIAMVFVPVYRVERDEVIHTSALSSFVFPVKNNSI